MRKRALLILAGLVVTAGVAAGFSRTDAVDDYRPKAEAGQARPPETPATTPPPVPAQTTPSISLELAEGAPLQPGQTISGRTSIAGELLQVRLKSFKGGQLVNEEVAVPGTGSDRAFSLTLNFDPALASGSTAVLEISESSSGPTSAVRLIREVTIR